MMFVELRQLWSTSIHQNSPYPAMPPQSLNPLPLFFFNAVSMHTTEPMSSPVVLTGSFDFQFSVRNW